MINTEQNPEPISEEIVRYYEEGREATRLASGIGALEMARTKQLIKRFAPDPPAVIADVGGGPGAYACWLAQNGYEVHHEPAYHDHSPKTVRNGRWAA